MRKNFTAQPSIYPMPVFIIATYDEQGTPDAMNAAWGGICSEKEISICVDRNHKTVKNLVATGAFTVSAAVEKYVVQCDYVGLVSGNDVPDKIARSGFTVVKSEFVNAPLIEQLPIALECKVKSWDAEAERLVGEIVNVSIDESVLNENGYPNPAKFAPLVFDPFNKMYLKATDAVAEAFSAGTKLM